jgi:hypothetical protein
MDARRDALAHRFIAYTIPETRDWPYELQIALHKLAFVALPVLVLELPRPDACEWAARWRVRITAPAPLVDPADIEWIAAIARADPRQPRTADEPTPTPAEIDRLAELLARLGPLALALPWRDDAPAKA